MRTSPCPASVWRRWPLSVSLALRRRAAGACSARAASTPSPSAFYTGALLPVVVQLRADLCCPRSRYNYDDGRARLAGDRADRGAGRGVRRRDAAVRQPGQVDRQRGGDRICRAVHRRLHGHRSCSCGWCGRRWTSSGFAGLLPLLIVHRHGQAQRHRASTPSAARSAGTNSRPSSAPARLGGRRRRHRAGVRIVSLTVVAAALAAGSCLGWRSLAGACWCSPLSVARRRAARRPGRVAAQTRRRREGLQRLDAGFGGVLDLLDSLLLAAPVAYLWFVNGFLDYRFAGRIIPTTRFRCNPLRQPRQLEIVPRARPAGIFTGATVAWRLAARNAFRAGQPQREALRKSRGAPDAPHME